jgi:hypothetical protein
MLFGGQFWAWQPRLKSLLRFAPRPFRRVARAKTHNLKPRYVTDVPNLYLSPRIIPRFAIRNPHFNLSFVIHSSLGRE